MYAAVFVYFILKVCEVGAKITYWKIKCLCHKHEDLSLSLRAHIKRLGVEAHACNFREQETDEPVGFAGQPTPGQWETVSSKVVDSTWKIPGIVFWPPYVHIPAVHEHTHKEVWKHIKKHVHTYKTLWESHCEPIFLNFEYFFSFRFSCNISNTLQHACTFERCFFVPISQVKLNFSFSCSYVTCHYEDTNNSFINHLQTFPHLPAIRKLKIKEMTSVSSLKSTHFTVVIAELEAWSALLCVPRWVSNLEWKYFALLFIKKKQD